MKITKKFLNDAQEFALDVGYEAGEILLKFQRKQKVYDGFTASI